MFEFLSVQLGRLSMVIWQMTNESEPGFDAGTDGTPNESVADVIVRVRQVLSITETQYNSATIVFVASDSSVLSIMQVRCMIDVIQQSNSQLTCPMPSIKVIRR